MPDGQEVREDADGIRRRVDEAVEARMGVAHRVGHDVLAHEREDLLERPALLGQRLVEERMPGRRSSRRPARESRPSRCAATASAASVPRRRSSPGGRSKVGFVMPPIESRPTKKGGRVPPLRVAEEEGRLTARPRNPGARPRRPDGCVFRSSAFSWNTTALPTTEFGPGLTVSMVGGHLEVTLAVRADRDVAPVAVVMLRVGRAARAGLPAGLKCAPAEEASGAEQSPFSWRWIPCVPGVAFSTQTSTFVPPEGSSVNTALPVTFEPLRDSIVAWPWRRPAAAAPPTGRPAGAQGDQRRGRPPPPLPESRFASFLPPLLKRRS